MKPLLSGSAALTAALLFGSFAFYAPPIAAEPTANPTIVKETNAPEATSEPATLAAPTPAKSSAAEFVAAAAPQSYVATAYSLRGRTASGLIVGKGMIAADHSVLPLGSRVRIEAGAYTGVYLVADTGSAVRGRKIDVWVPTTREALQFGRRKVRLTVLSYGERRRTRRR